MLADLAPSVHSRLQLPRNMGISPKQVASLWLLCCQQAVLNGTRDAACALFTAEVIACPCEALCVEKLGTAALGCTVCLVVIHCCTVLPSASCMRKCVHHSHIVDHDDEQERALLEWVDDESLFQTRSHAARIAYHMAAPLVADVSEAMAAAAAAASPEIEVGTHLKPA